ncbi:MAG: glycosyltransferase [Acidithiobacillus ferrivorans]
MVAERLNDFDMLVYMMQDGIQASPDGLENLVSAFSDPEVGVAYGRQLPRDGASPVEAHTRLFNYLEQSNKRTLADKSKLGIKAAFTSNSFAAYRTKAVFDVGGFPSKLILGEDMVVAARMLLAGWSVAYVADAQVYHSHGYTVLQ